MRRVSGLAFVAFGSVLLSASGASADGPALPIFSDQLLRDAAFDRGRFVGDPRLASDTVGYAPGRGVVRWRTDQFAVGPNQRVSLSLGGADPTPAGQPLGPLQRWDAGDARLYDLGYQRDWPAAVRGKAGGLAFDVTPRAGLGLSSAGGSAGAGATVRIGENLEEDVVDALTDALGLNTVEASSFSGRGRWYLYAAADGRAVGLNVLRNRDGDWSRGGWSSDASSELVSEAQVGVGWRRGAVQASFGYLHRELKVGGIHNAETTKMDDGAVAFSLSIKPEG